MSRASGAGTPPGGRPAPPGDSPAFETRPWGGFETIQEGAGYKVKRLVVEPGGRLSLQRHRLRAESWVVVTGSPRVTVSGRARRIRAREIVTVPRGAWHRIENRGKTPVVIIEVQHGPYLGEDDIIRLHDDYGRADARASASRGGAPAARAVGGAAAGRPKRQTPAGPARRRAHGR